TAPALEAIDVRKRFEVRGWVPGRPRASVEALRGATLTVARDTIHGVIGPNGSGKSTLLRVLATLVIADSGQARVNGHDVRREERAVRRVIGFTTGEERSLYWRLTARQNLEFAAQLYHLKKPKAAVTHALEVVGLAADAERPVSGFSQGMSRRLGLARAILHEPPVLLLDEPTRSLDPTARAEFQEVLRVLRREKGVTTLLTTHDLGEASAVCDRVSVLYHGQFANHLASADEELLVAALDRLVSQ
ncbi:MAG: ABC transporter ATP-binding protein, partial [Acidimicrobiia bacterium]|nr:ABC transporter ATP-binding protein [Acidimicrobiia bacterium]